PQGTTAYLVLAYGTSANQYALVVEAGGTFSIRGSTKTPYTTAPGDVASGPRSITVADATGWQLGDTVTVDTESVTLTSVPSGNSFNISGTNFNHYSSNTIRVTNLTRNAVVRSSGTDTSSNTAYIEYDANSFQAAHAEFAYLGSIHLWGSSFHSISSST